MISNYFILNTLGRSSGSRNRALLLLLGSLVLATGVPFAADAQPVCVTITGVTTTSGSVIVTATDFTGVNVGDTVTGPGIASATTVTGMVAGTLTLSAAAMATGTVDLTFCPAGVSGGSVPEFGLSAVTVAAVTLVGLVFLRKRVLSLK